MNLMFTYPNTNNLVCRNKIISFSLSNTKRIASLFFILQYSILFISAKTWQPVGSGVKVSEGSSSWIIYDFVVYRNELYVVGDFQTNGKGDSINYIAKFNGNDWEKLGAGTKTKWGIESACVFNNKLFVGGDVLCSDGKYSKGIACWDGTIWNHLGEGLSGVVKVMEVYKNELYVGGLFDSAGTKIVNNIARWNDTIWKDVGGGVTGVAIIWPAPIPEVNILFKYNSLLLVGGNFNFVNQTENWGFATWDGEIWGGKFPGLSDRPNLEFYRNRLYSGAEGIYRLDSTSSIEYKIAEFGAGCFQVYNNELYVGGIGDSIGGIKIRNIARWNDTVWQDVGGGTGSTPFETSGAIKAMIVFDSSLYIAGDFTEAGGRQISGVARLDMTIKPGVKESISTHPLVQVISNPSTGEVFVKLQTPEGGLFEILDLNGKKILSQMARSSMRIGIEHLPSGLYLYRFSTSSGKVSRGKVVKVFGLQ